MMWTPASSVHSVVLSTNKFTQTPEVLWTKRDGTATLWVRECPEPCLDRLLLLSNNIHQRGFSFIMLQVCFRWLLFSDNRGKDVADYFLQINKEKMLPMQGNEKCDWSGYTPSLGLFPDRAGLHFIAKQIVFLYYESLLLVLLNIYTEEEFLDHMLTLFLLIVRNIHTALYRGCIMLYSHQQHIQVLNFSHPCQYLFSVFVTVPSLMNVRWAQPLLLSLT